MPYSLRPPGFGRASKTVTSCPSIDAAMGAGEAGGAGADHRDALAARTGAREGLDVALQQRVGGVALQCADLHGLGFLGRAHAGILAEDFDGTDARARPAHDVFLQDGDGRALDVVGRDLADEAGDVDAGRAGLQARRVVAEIAAAGLDQGAHAIERRMDVREILGELRRTQTTGSDIARLSHSALSRRKARRAPWLKIMVATV